MGFDVRRNGFHHVVLPRPVFHELTRHFDGIPFDAVDAGKLRGLDAAQHMVQPVTEFMEKRFHVVVREESRFVAHGFGKVADEVSGGRTVRAVREIACRQVVIHPGAAALRGAGVKIGVELSDEFSRRVGNAPELHVLMPHGGGVFRDADVKKPFDESEESFKDLGKREVLLHFLIGIAVVGFTEFFGGVRGVPGLKVRDSQRIAGEGFKFFFVLFGPRFAFGGQVLKERENFGRRLCHFGRKRHFGVIFKAQEFRFFLAKG